MATWGGYTDYNSQRDGGPAALIQIQSTPLSGGFLKA
jgi:hypothetical protein